MKTLDTVRCKGKRMVRCVNDASSMSPLSVWSCHGWSPYYWSHVEHPVISAHKGTVTPLINVQCMQANIETGRMKTRCWVGSTLTLLQIFLFSDRACFFGQDPGTPPPKRHIFQWLQKDLKAKIDELSTKVGRRKHFQYGPDERDILTGYNSEKVVVLANSLDKYWDWQVEIGKHGALRSWDQGTTPEKSVAKGKGGKTSADPERKPHFLVLLVCHLGNDSTFEGFLKLCEPKTRHDVEDPSNSNAANFYKALARDMLDVDFKDDHGNEISIPVSHSNDNPEAPEELLEILDNIDFDLAKRELNGRVDGDIKRLVSVLPLWMKFIQGETKVC